MGKPGSGATSKPTVKGTRGNDVMTVVDGGVMVNNVLKPFDPLIQQAGFILNGDSGNDVIRGGVGPDEISGGAGDDTIYGLPNDIRLDGGSGFDTLDVSQATGSIRYLGTYGGQLTYWPDATPSTYTIATGFERVIGSFYADYLFGSSYGDRLEGGGGDDHLDGQSGNDVLIGGLGNDFFEFSSGSAGADTVLDFQFGQDHLFFYGHPQPNVADIFVRGGDLVVPWANGTVTLAGLGYLDADDYQGLFTLNNGELYVVV